MTINLRKITQGERGTLTFTWEFPENLTSPASISGATITATMTDEDGVTTAVSGTLTGASATTCTWALSAGDSGTAGTFTVLFKAVATGVTTYTLEATLEVIANPAVTGTQNEPLVSISAADAAWVTVGAAGGALGDAAYEDTTAFDAAGAAAAVRTVLQAATIAVTVPAVTAGGIVDNAVNIQAVIDALPADGGIIHMPAGTYKVSAHCLEIIGLSKCILQGAGLGITILDFSTTPDIASHTSRGIYSRGAITIDTASQVIIRDLTIKMPTTGSDAKLKALYVKESSNIEIDSVEIDHSVNEAIYCEGSLGRDNFSVTSCQIHDHTMTAIDINTVDGDAQYITDNYIYDGGSGIACRGKRSIVSRNVIKDCIGMGIALYHEGSGLYHLDDIISNNIITAISSGGGLTARGIFVSASTLYDEGGVLVSGNVISNITQESGKTCHGLHLAGAVNAIGNIIRGTTGTGATTTIAIETAAANSRIYLSGNIIEPVTTDEQRWQYGFFCAGNGNAIFQNNVVYADAIGDGVNIAFRDTSGAAIMQGNILQGSVVYGATTFNGTGTLDLAQFGTKLAVGLLGSNERLPMTANIIMLTKYYIPWHVGTNVAIADGSMTYGNAQLYGAVIGDTVIVACTDTTAVPGGVVFSGQVTSADTVTITCYNKSGANYTPPYAAGKYRLCAFR